jgi:UDP-N-acetylmuramate--alanine ligase
MQTTEIIDWDRVRGTAVHMVGVKGTGMAALAAMLHGAGARVTGSDTGDTFATDAVLRKLDIGVSVGFDALHVPSDVRLVVHSPAFDPATNPELVEAARRGIPVASYPSALGSISAQFDSSGIAGSHGKTTTTAMCAVLCRALRLEATVLVPTLLPDLDDMPVHAGGRRYFVAETCEYRRHFLHFRPRRIVLTTVEAEHLDYYRDLADVRSAFVEYAGLLPPGGLLVHNADDAGCAAVVAELGDRKLDVVAYGRRADGDYRIVEMESPAGSVRFRLAGDPLPYELRIPGTHNAYNAAAAIALVCALAGEPLSREPASTRDAMRRALAAFRGSKRRAEIVGSARGVLVIDDYGHHPTEVAVTLQGLKRFYAGRRLIVDFMPHLFSRTRTLFNEFVGAFDAADEVILHRIYASAREKDDGTVTGRALADAVAARRPSVHYFDEPLEALGHLEGSLRAGDVLVTMGAGDNWKLGRAVLDRLAGQGGAS